MRRRRPAAEERRRGGEGRRRGAALVLIFLLLAILSIVVAEFVYELRIESALAKNFEAKLMARSVARAGQNAARGLLLNASPQDERIFNNELVQLFRYTCMTVDTRELLFEQGAEKEKKEEKTAPPAMENCGQWSLSIPYVLVDTPLEVEIYDEQARLNLNALMRRVSGGPPPPGQPQPPSGGEEEFSFTRNNTMFNIIYELFRYQIMVHHLEMSEMDLVVMLNNLCDYLDYGTVDGSFDDDSRNYFEYEEDERIVPLKNGPLDTVDEIRYLPGMTDELFSAVKPFLTVYPADYDRGYFFDKVNFNAAPVEVLYAIYRGTSYQAGDPSLSEEEAWKMAVETVQGTSEKTRGTNRATPPSPAAAAAGITIIPYKRTLPQQCLANTLCAGIVMPENQNPRFYRVVATAQTGDGLETTITRVVKHDKRLNSLEVLYYSEE